MREDFLMPTKRTETSNSTIEKAIKDVTEKEPAAALKSVETSKQSIKKDFTFAPSTSIGALPIIGSGVSIDTSITANSLEVHESNLPKALPNNVHVASAVWSVFQAIFPGSSLLARKCQRNCLECFALQRFLTVIMSKVFQNEFPYFRDNMETSEKQV